MNTKTEIKLKKLKMVSSSIKTYGSLLIKISNGVSVKPSISPSIAPQCSVVITRKISSSSWYTSTSYFWRFLLPIEVENECSVRKISTFGPLCMGRRSCKIADRKDSQNAKKMKLYSSFGKQVVSVVKRGGPNPVSNTALAALIDKAKELDVPKDIVERNIKRASEKGQEAYIEKFYELYGYGGVGIIAEVLTDKVHRSVAKIRDVARDCGGKMADSGSIMFKFRRARVATIKVTDVDKDQLLSIALDAGADDVIEPSSDEDDINENRSERYFKVVSSAENYPAILSRLRDEGIAFETDKGFELVPLTQIEVDDEAMDLNKEIINKLLELDDVDAVYTDQKD